MRKLFLILGVITSSACYAINPGDEALLSTVVSEAHGIKGSCIDPLIPDTSCGAQLATYVINLGLLNKPLPLSKPTDGYQSPYYLSPFDICVFDTARVAVPDLC